MLQNYIISYSLLSFNCLITRNGVNGTCDISYITGVCLLHGYCYSYNTVTPMSAHAHVHHVQSSTDLDRDPDGVFYCLEMFCGIFGSSFYDITQSCGLYHL